MKKLNLSTNAKKGIAVTGIAVICISLAVVIALNVHSEENRSTLSETSTEVSSDINSSIASISVAPIQQTQSASSSSAFVPEKGKSSSSALTITSKPSSAPSKPVIKGDSTVNKSGKRISQPTNSALTNKNSKPTYSSKPSASASTSSKGSGKPGQIYVPGFGWQYPTGGEGTKVDGDWGGGNQVGTMD